MIYQRALEIEMDDSGISFAREPLIFGVHPYLPSSELYKRFMPLLDYLSKETGQPMQLNISSTYEKHIESIGTGNVNIAYMGPASYVHMVNKYGRNPLLARLEIKGSPTFRGVIIVRKEDKSTELKDLLGKSFAFGDPASTMSSLVPHYMLIKAGIELEELSGYIHLRNHINVALSVLVGDSDAGAVKEEVFYKYEQRGLKALAFTPRISEHLLIGHNTLPAEVIDSLRKALFNIKDTKHGRAIMTAIKSSMSAFVPVQDEDYDNLRIIMQTVMKNDVQK